MPELRAKVDRRGSPQAINDEAHVIGEDVANVVFLDERPDEGVGVTIAGFTEVSGVPAAGEFNVVYPSDPTDPAWGKIVFHASNNGTAILVDYSGHGSDLFARDPNRVRAKLQGVKVLTDGATVSLNFGDEWLNRVVLGGNRTVDVATFPPAGAVVGFEVRQDATGSRTITWDGADFDFGTAGAPTLTTTASKMDLLTFYSTGAKLHYIGSALGFTP